MEICMVFFKYGDWELKIGLKSEINIVLIVFILNYRYFIVLNCFYVFFSVLDENVLFYFFYYFEIFLI